MSRNRKVAVSKPWPPSGCMSKYLWARYCTPNHFWWEVGNLHGSLCHQWVDVKSVVKHFEQSVDWKSPFNGVVHGSLAVMLDFNQHFSIYYSLIQRKGKSKVLQYVKFLTTSSNNFVGGAEFGLSHSGMTRYENNSWHYYPDNRENMLKTLEKHWNVLWSLYLTYNRSITQHKQS